MQMSIAEIRRVYSQARDKKKQIPILADLNCCSTKEILDIVHNKEYEKTADESAKEESFKLIPEQKALIDRLEEVDGQIKELEKEYQFIAKRLCDGGVAVEKLGYERKIS